MKMDSAQRTQQYENSYFLKCLKKGKKLPGIGTVISEASSYKSNISADVIKVNTCQHGEASSMPNPGEYMNAGVTIRNKLHDNLKNSYAPPITCKKAPQPSPRKSAENPKTDQTGRSGIKETALREDEEELQRKESDSKDGWVIVRRVHEKFDARTADKLKRTATYIDRHVIRNRIKSEEEKVSTGPHFKGKNHGKVLQDKQQKINRFHLVIPPPPPPPVPKKKPPRTKERLLSGNNANVDDVHKKKERSGFMDCSRQDRRDKTSK